MCTHTPFDSQRAVTHPKPHPRSTHNGHCAVPSLDVLCAEGYTAHGLLVLQSANLTTSSFLFLFRFVILCHIFTSWALNVSVCTKCFILRYVVAQGPRQTLRPTDGAAVSSHVSARGRFVINWEGILTSATYRHCALLS